MPVDSAAMVSERNPARGELVVRVALVLAFAWLVLSTAWLGDDAYITLRTVANYLGGHGLVWNVGERVQAYTHPLWLMLLIPAHALTGEPYYSTIFLSIVLSIAAAGWIALRIAPDTPSAVLAIVALASSKAYVDYSTSGLENPLTHLLLVLLYCQSRRIEPGPGRLMHVGLLTSFVLLNRLDLALLMLPIIVAVAWPRRSWTSARALLLGAAPLIAWEVFSLIYYGFPLPNTAYAKLDPGVPAGRLLAQGLAYYQHTLRIDWVTALAIVGGLIVATMRRDTISRAVAIGVALHLLYILKIGGDFMGGRMLTAPLLLCVLLVADSQLLKPRITFLAAGIVAALGLLSPLSPLATPWPERVKDKYMDGAGIADEPAFYFESTGLPLVCCGKNYEYTWMEEGHRMATAAAAADAAVLTVHSNIGFFGYLAGPRVHVVDELALADAFLARMPRNPDKPWRVGNTFRVIPDGYLESIQTGENRLTDPVLAARFERMRRITRGPLLDWQRFSDILRENLGIPATAASAAR